MESKTLTNLEFSKILSIIASYASSRPAKERILNFEVSVDINFILTGLNETEEYIDYSEMGLKLNPGGLRDIRETLEVLSAGSTILGSEDFSKIKSNIETAASIKKAFESQDKQLLNKTTRIGERIKKLPLLNSLYERINDCFDDKGLIKSSASPALASIRREYIQTVAQTEKELNAYIAHHGDSVQDRYFTLRNDRYVIPINASSQSSIQGIVHDQSATGQTVFIEPLQFLGANNRLAQLRLSETEEIKRILTALTNMLYQSLSYIREQFETLVWLDTVKAKANFAGAYGACRPDVSEKGDLVLHNARHPLLHPNCVPLDIFLNKNQRCIIITGPNGGGKTVSMKTVGLNALLMQTGNYVLANNDAKLPIFTEILSDIGESQSIEDHLSTFTSHLKRLKEIADVADSRSLILIDEICVGTDPIEGGALASGFLKELCGRGAYAIVTSHYDSLKNMAFTTEGFINAAMEFDYDTFKPTFRFQMGIPGRSNALAMARAFQLPENILTDLVGVNKGERQNEKGLIEAIERERNRAESLRRTYVKKITAIRSKEQEIEEITEQLKEFRKTKRDKLTEEFTVELRKKLKDIEKVINKLKNTATNNNGQEIESAVKEARETHQLIKSGIEDLNQTDATTNENKQSLSVDDFKPGMYVIWNQNLRTGKFIRTVGKSKAEVDFEGILISVNLSELSVSHRKESKKEKKETGHVYAVRPLIRSEIDLRGKRVEEALDEVESYLKMADQSNLGRVYIIHGKGTGALQRAIADFLKNSPWKKKYRSGRYGEGDLGVTVVVFDPEADVDHMDPRNADKGK